MCRAPYTLHTIGLDHYILRTACCKLHRVLQRTQHLPPPLHITLPTTLLTHIAPHMAPYVLHTTYCAAHTTHYAQHATRNTLHAIAFSTSQFLRSVLYALRAALHTQSPDLTRYVVDHELGIAIMERYVSLRPLRSHSGLKENDAPLAQRRLCKSAW